MTILVRRAALLSLFFGAAPAFAEEPAPAKAGPSPKEVEMKVHETLAASAPAIDACTAAYTNEYPAAAGKAVIDATVVKDGSVGQAAVNTALEGARNLRLCLERVAKGWRLPPIHGESEKLTLTINVKKGARFSLLKPGEKPAPGQPQAEQQDGFVSFLPQSWAEGGN